MIENKTLSKKSNKAIVNNMVLTAQENTLIPNEPANLKEITDTVPTEYKGMRFDIVLAKIFNQYSRVQLKTWLESGAIKISSNKIYKPKDKVLGGEIISLLVPQTNVTHNLAEEIPIDIIYENDDFMIINKSYNMVVHPGAGNATSTLLNALLFHCPTLALLPRAGIIHRLDKDTTGLLLVAKNIEAYNELSRQMQNRLIQRHYIAVVHGQIHCSGIINTLYARHPKNRLKMSVCKKGSHGKYAITEYNVLKKYKNFTVLDVKLHTGRTHQIRVHMSYIHHAIVGDALYGGQMPLKACIHNKIKLYIKNFTRQALHAKTLYFVYNKETYKFEAPLPDDLNLLIDTIEQDDKLSTC